MADLDSGIMVSGSASTRLNHIGRVRRSPLPSAIAPVSSDLLCLSKPIVPGSSPPSLSRRWQGFAGEEPWSALIPTVRHRHDSSIGRWASLGGSFLCRTGAVTKKRARFEISGSEVLKCPEGKLGWPAKATQCSQVPGIDNTSKRLHSAVDEQSSEAGRSLRPFLSQRGTTRHSI